LILQILYPIETHILQLGSYFIRLKDEELNLRQQVRELKSEQGTVSMSEEFAKYMKLQRKIDRLVEQVKKMGKICFRSQDKVTLLNHYIRSFCIILFTTLIILCSILSG